MWITVVVIVRVIVVVTYEAVKYAAAPAVQVELSLAVTMPQLVKVQLAPPAIEMKSDTAGVLAELARSDDPSFYQKFNAV